MSDRIRLSSSPLARPDRPIHVLASKIQGHIYLPNPDPLYTVLGTLVGNMLRGKPVWLVLISPPSGGKTLLLDILYRNDDYRLARVCSTDMVNSIGGLLSGTSQKEKKKGCTGGLLKRVGTHGMLVIKDFTSMMSLPRDPLITVMGALRRVYDGDWERDIGGEGGGVLRWKGKVGFLSACTRAIDKHHELLSDLGERWMYYQYGESDGYGETMAVLKNKDPQQSMMTMFELVEEFLDNLGVSWSEEGMERRELEEVESNRLFAMATLGAASRSGVVRDYRTKEITSVKQTEQPSRLAAALGQLYLGLETIGLDADERWKIVGKIALDSMPQTRLKVLERLRKGSASTTELKEVVGVSQGTIRKTTEDLEMHGVVEHVMKGDRMGDRANSYRLTSWTKKQLSMGWIRE